MEKKRLPAILIDNDGVVVKGSSVIGRAAQILRSLMEPYSESKVQIPFALFTNGGGLPEEEKA